MGSYFVVPRLLGLIGDGFLNIIVVLCGMFYIIIATHGILLMSVEFGLEHVGEHLDIVASGTVAFRNEGIDIADVPVEAIGETDFRQQLGIGLLTAVDNMRSQMISGLTLSGAARHVHISEGVVLDFHIVDIESQTKGEFEVIAQEEVRLVEGSKGHRGCLERLGYGHLCRHGHAANGSVNSLLGSSLGSLRSRSLSDGFGHALRHHLLEHLVVHLLIHARIHRLLHSAPHGIGDGIADRPRDGIAEIDRCIGTQPLIGAE